MPAIYTKAETLLRNPKGSVSEAIIAARGASRPFESGSAYRPPTSEQNRLPIHPQAAFKDPYSNETWEVQPMRARMQAPRGKARLPRTKLPEERNKGLMPAYKAAYSTEELGAKAAAQWMKRGKPQFGSTAVYAGSLLEDPLVEVFRQLDQDGSGNINKQELTWAFQKLCLTKAQIEAQLASFEENAKDISELEGGSGAISLPEWEKGLLPEVRKIIQTKCGADGKLIGFEDMLDIKKTFKTFMKHFDTDVSGKLTIPELERALKSIHMGSGEIKAFLAVFANDKDGFIDKKEFETKLTSKMIEKLHDLMVAHGLMIAPGRAAECDTSNQAAHLNHQWSIGA